MARKNDVARFMYDVSPETCFWCTDGQILRNLSELETALKRMNAKTFKYHVTSKKNDFSNWVADILLDKTLANSLKKSKTKAGALKAVKTKLAKLS